MAGKDTVTVRKTGRMCVFSLYFKALDRKGVRKVLQNNFSVCLFNNWQQEYNERKKKGTNSLSKLLTCSSQTMPLWEGVCVSMCAWVLQCRLRRQGSTPTRGQALPRILSGNRSFDLTLSLPSPLLLLNFCPAFSPPAWRVASHFRILWEAETCLQFVTLTETSERSLGQMSYV